MFFFQVQAMNTSDVNIAKIFEITRHSIECRYYFHGIGRR